MTYLDRQQRADLDRYLTRDDDTDENGGECGSCESFTDPSLPDVGDLYHHVDDDCRATHAFTEREWQEAHPGAIDLTKPQPYDEQPYEPAWDAETARHASQAIAAEPSSLRRWELQHDELQRLGGLVRNELASEYRDWLYAVLGAAAETIAADIHAAPLDTTAEYRLRDAKLGVLSATQDMIRHLFGPDPLPVGAPAGMTLTARYDGSIGDPRDAYDLGDPKRLRL